MEVVNVKQLHPYRSDRTASRLGKLSPNLITYHDPKSPAAEAFRSLRTNIGFADIDHDLKMLVITSPGPFDGKTTVASNFAITMAKIDKKVLMIDCDLRKPRLHKNFGLNNDIGLTHILNDMIVDGMPSTEFVKKVPLIDNLWVITSGFIPPNPTEVLASKKMENFLKQVQKEYDLVILDTPPVASLTDAAILGKQANGVVLVVSSGETEIEMALHAKQALTNVDAKILGVVITKLEKGVSGYYYYYKNYNYNYYYYYYYYNNENDDS